jgi:vitamin B12 transporter
MLGLFYRRLTAYLHAIRPVASSVFAILVALDACNALADPYVQTLDAVEVTGQRTPEPVADALLSTTVISRQDIEQSQMIDLVSILRQVAGVEIAQAGGVGGQASLFLRGANSDQTLFMIDGVRINSVESGGAFLQHIMLSQVDHIEIVRGNVSALYGSQAVGGVVQIFTRSDQGGLAGGADLTVGGDDTRNVSVHLSDRFGPVNALTNAGITLSSTESGGFSAIDAARAPFANPSDNNYRNHSLSASLSQEIGPVKLSARLFDSEAHLDYDDPTNYSFLDPAYTGQNVDNYENSSLQTVSLLAEWNINPELQASLGAGGELDRSDNNSTFPGSFDIGSTKSQTNDYTLNVRWTALEHLTLNGGLEYIDQSGESSAYLARFKRNVDSVFVGALGSYGPNQLQFNLRSDDYSDFGSATSALLSYGYALTAQLKLIGSVSTAFTAPTFDDLFYPGASNPTLRPEKSRSAELGVAFNDTRSQARIALYRSTIHDLIAFDDVRFIPENIDEARLEGIELSGQTNWRDVTLSANMTFDHPIDVGTDQPLLRRATRSGNLNLSYQYQALRPYVEVSASGLRFDSDINTFERVSLGGYAIANAGVRYTFSKQLSAGLSVDNLADRRYALIDGYNTPGRVVLVTLSGSLP